jgi:hypothetical protein
MLQLMPHTLPSFFLLGIAADTWFQHQASIMLWLPIMVEIPASSNAWHRPTGRRYHCAARPGEELRSGFASMPLPPERPESSKDGAAAHPTLRAHAPRRVPSAAVYDPYHLSDSPSMPDDFVLVS